MGGIYIASKTKYAPTWRRWRDTLGHPICSTWIDEAGVGETSDFKDLWDRIEQEVTHAQALMLYYDPTDSPLKGAFIELGIARANKVPMYVVCGDPNWTFLKAGWFKANYTSASGAMQAILAELQDL